MAPRCPRWSAALKADFRNKIESRHINPKRTDRDYILKIRDKYYQGRPDNTFIANFNTSVAEWRADFYVNEYNKTKKCEFSVSGSCLYHITRLTTPSPLQLQLRLLLAPQRTTTSTSARKTTTTPTKEKKISQYLLETKILTLTQKK